MKQQSRFLPGLLIGLIGGLSVQPLVQWIARATAPPPVDVDAASAAAADLLQAQHARRLRDREVAREVIAGGLILHFRHGHRQKWDSVIAFDVHELATGTDSAAASYRDAVCLSAQGVEEGRMIGETFRLAGAAVGSVIASPSCRAQQTAMLAFGRIDATDVALAHTPVVNQDNAAAFAARLATLYRKTPMPAQGNLAVVAHGNTLENHPDLFVRGAELLGPPYLFETGFYVIRRLPDGGLELVHEFASLGDFAAAAITLSPTPEAGRD